MKVKEPFVLNRGQWNVVIEGSPGKNNINFIIWSMDNGYIDMLET